MSNLTKYEQNALEEIRLWKNPKTTVFGRIVGVITWPLDKAGEAVMKIPGVGFVIEKAVGGIVEVANDAAQWSVSPDAIFQEYRDDGHEKVHSIKDIFDMHLSAVDKSIGYLGAKYKALALAEGGAAGLAGLPGMLVDIPALVVLNLRAIGEYATYCGFDVGLQQERLFAINVLGLASSPTDASKQVAMAQLVKIATEVAKKRTWKELEKHAFVAMLRQISKALGMRLTKAKLAQAVPVVGAVVGGGFNAYFTSKVCDAAYYLYRERFLAQKYGADVIK